MELKQKIETSRLFQALGDPTRFRLFELLGEGQQYCVSTLAELCHISPACVSQHMKVLEGAGLVAPERQGQRVCYRVITDSSAKRVISSLVHNKVKGRPYAG